MKKPILSVKARDKMRGKRCIHCDGEGYKNGRICSVCHGSGRV